MASTWCGQVSQDVYDDTDELQPRPCLHQSLHIELDAMPGMKTGQLLNALWCPAYGCAEAGILHSSYRAHMKEQMRPGLVKGIRLVLRPHTVDYTSGIGQKIGLLGL